MQDNDLQMSPATRWSFCLDVNVLLDIYLKRALVKANTVWITVEWWQVTTWVPHVKNISLLLTPQLQVKYIYSYKTIAHLIKSSSLYICK